MAESSKLLMYQLYYTFNRNQSIISTPKCWWALTHVTRLFFNKSISGEVDHKCSLKRSDSNRPDTLLILLFNLDPTGPHFLVRCQECSKVSGFYGTATAEACQVVHSSAWKWLWTYIFTLLVFLHPCSDSNVYSSAAFTFVLLPSRDILNHIHFRDAHGSGGKAGWPLITDQLNLFFPVSLFRCHEQSRV